MAKNKNLIVIHLESIAWQAFNAFPEAFPNLNRFIPAARLYRSYFSSATSTQMVLGYLSHGNDFEFDAAPGLSQPAANNPSLFSILQAAGYQTDFLCVTAWPGKAMLPQFALTLPPVWRTNDYSELLQRFEKLTATRTFAIYVWNLVTHIEHAAALAPYTNGVSDLMGGACAVADHALGSLLAILERKNLMDETTIVIFGDHGDDYWTHGFKKGLLHGMEPYTHLVHAPLLIRDASLPVGNDNRLTSTVDLAPTCLELLGLPAQFPFAESGQSLLHGGGRECTFSQNFTGNQPDAADMDVRKAFSVNDRSHTLIASSRGLEFFNHRLDPTNHCNLLHFFDMGGDGELVLRTPAGYCHPHFSTTLRRVLSNEHALRYDFRRLRGALKAQVGKKNSYIAKRATTPINTLALSCLDTINRYGRDRFFDIEGEAVAPAVPGSISPTNSPLSGVLKTIFRRRGGPRP